MIGNSNCRYSRIAFLNNKVGEWLITLNPGESAIFAEHVLSARHNIGVIANTYLSDINSNPPILSFMFQVMLSLQGLRVDESSGNVMYESKTWSPNRANSTGWFMILSENVDNDGLTFTFELKVCAVNTFKCSKNLDKNKTKVNLPPAKREGSLWEI